MQCDLKLLEVLLSMAYELMDSYVSFVLFESYHSFRASIIILLAALITIARGLIYVDDWFQL